MQDPKRMPLREGKARIW